MSLRLPWSQLYYAPSNGSYIYGTYIREVGRLGIEDRKMANDSRDNGRKNEIITSRRILIDIYKGEYKMKRKVNRKILNDG